MNRAELIALLKARNTAADRFALAGLQHADSHGGRPTSALVNGQIVFTYPDGTQTCGGVRIN